MTNDLLSLSTNEFIAGIEAIAPRFDSATYPQQNLPADDWTLLTRAGVLLPTLPKEYGGRDSHIEMCRVVETLSEWNLPLGMYVTVITAVALRPIVLWAGEEAKQEVLPLYAGGDPMICGFASTEPGCGSAMSGMTTTFEEVEGGYRIRGRKHWQAFSLSAHWWLVSAKNDEHGRREYGYFIVKRSEGFRTLQPYEPLGLKVIDYGLNEIDAVVPRHRRIPADGRTLRPMVEMLMASRAMMAAMGCGFLRRISREAHAYADRRRIGPGPQSAIRFVRYRLAAIDASYTVCAALNHHLQTALDMKDAMIGAFPAVQAIKTVATERMLSAAHHYQQLVGGEGYRCGSPTNISAQAFLDARVYTIFDGTNDLLSQQLTEYCLARTDGRALSRFLAEWPLTAPAVAAHRLDLGFLDQDLRQEHMVLAGRAIAYVFAIGQVMRWAAETGADAGRTRAAIEFLKADIAGVATEFGLLATGLPGLGDDAAAPPAGVPFSRSIPAATEA
ncbi:acyl-CoA dehydrogenase family protein [Thermomonospora cellulosilytica]|uniref:Alkylation response protein AidB-like acyl-CoA dehydrogenase n=1 Tax=Thermomonospora cellulosilytica TaxID=1411118 RepID=A0A7W3MWG0_9ACTN|nr:acyl-CoA dehydrogenase family protein [Thermomonospora cellulosilytica]MBA9003094.1 alkylation response protein AidB-like acyl-CoA dehydrogenase [Thermomonospora cellulosilytica]